MDVLLQRPEREAATPVRGSRSVGNWSQQQKCEASSMRHFDILFSDNIVRNFNRALHYDTAIVSDMHLWGVR